MVAIYESLDISLPLFATYSLMMGNCQQTIFVFCYFIKSMVEKSAIENFIVMDTDQIYGGDLRKS